MKNPEEKICLSASKLKDISYSCTPKPAMSAEAIHHTLDTQLQYDESISPIGLQQYILAHEKPRRKYA